MIRRSYFIVPTQQAGTGPFVPTLLSNCVLWLRGDSIAQQAGTAVATWADESGNNNHAQQAATGAQPALETSPNRLNFDGNTDYISSPHSALLDFSYTDEFAVNVAVNVLDNGRTYGYNALVSKLKQNSAAQGETSWNGDGGWYLAAVKKNASQYALMFAMHNVNNGAVRRYTIETNNLFLFNTSYAITCVKKSGANAQIFVNGVEHAFTVHWNTINPADSTKSTEPLHLGIINPTSPYYFKGRMFETILYNRSLSGSEVTSVQNYLRGKYSI